MYIVVCTILLSVVVVLSLPALSVCWSLTKRWRSRPPRTPSAGELPRLLFLIPAHNEELLIRECVNSIMEIDYPVGKRDVVVVADNCSDQTGAIATTCGAQSLERHDPTLPGKPRALAWALKRLAPVTRWDACVVIDADTVVDKQFASQLARYAPLRGKAVQSYFAVANEDESWLTRLGAVLSTAQYELLYPLKVSVGLNCPLTGNGMCLGTDLLVDGWTAFSLTEDWELYAQYTSNGTSIGLAQGARLWSQEARSLHQGTTQRRRWSAGRLGTLRAYWRRLVASPTIGSHQKLDALGELAYPGPILHATATTLLVATAWAACDERVAATITALAAFALAPMVAATVVAISRQRRPWRALLSFAFLTVYAPWRLLTAMLTVATMRQNQWLKTERHSSG